MIDLEKSERRRLLEASFEPRGEDFVYYRHRWALGYPVTAAEREEYLANWTIFASQRELLKRIAGRPSVAPPRSGNVRWVVIDALPGSTAGVFALVALAVGVRASYAHEPSLRLGALAIAALLAAFSLVIFIRRLRTRRPKD